MKKITLLATLMIISLLSFITSASAVGSESEYKPVPSSEDTVTVMVSSLEEKDGHLYLKADNIEWYEGAAADKKFLKREKDTDGMDGALDGYYIVNDEVKLESYEIAPDAKVLMQIYDHDGSYEGMDIKWNEPVSLNKFQAIYNNNSLLDIKAFPFHLTIQDGKVVQIIQQYIP